MNSLFYLARHNVKRLTRDSRETGAETFRCVSLIFNSLVTQLCGVDLIGEALCPGCPQKNGIALAVTASDNVNFY